MIGYRATLDVPNVVFATVVQWIRAHRERVDRRPWQRVASCRDQAMLVPRHLKDATLLDAAAPDIAISPATGYRYFHDAIDAIAEHAPDLAAVLDRAQLDAWSHIKRDGTLVPATRPSVRTEHGSDAWYSGTHKQHGGDRQVLDDRTGSQSKSPQSNPARPATLPADRS